MAKADKQSEQPSQQDPPAAPASAPGLGGITAPGQAPPFVPLAQALAAQSAQPPAAPEPEPPPRHLAVRIENADGTVWRAPPGVHLSALGDIVHGNFHGNVGGHSWRVMNGTPSADLPRDIVRAILQSEPRAIGPFKAPVSPTLV